jgi:hypothetical protein
MPEWTLLVVVGVAGWFVVSILVGVMFGHLLHRLFAEPEQARVLQRDTKAARLNERRAA